MLSTIKKNPAAFKKIFIHSDKELTWQDIDAIFTIEELDIVGSNLRNKQEKAIEHWRDYLIDCSGM